MSVGTQTLTMEVKRKFKLAWKKQLWPEPQNSIDFPCGTLGGLPCWTVRGEAKRLFAEIEDGIKNLLQDRMDDIADCQHSLESFGWCMYMRGRDETHAEPVLLFECFDRKTLAKVVDIVKKSQLWKNIIEKHPALRLASSSRGPQGSCFTVDMLENSDGSNAVYSDGPLHQLYGVQIYVNSFQHSSSLSFRKATLGGLILIDDVFHAMTVAHLFEDAPQTQTRLDEASNDFAFEDDSEMEDDVSVDITSRGSVTPQSTFSSPDHNDSSIESESTSLNNYNGLTMDSPIANTIDSEPNQPEKVQTRNHLGFLKAMSNNTLDWAIFPIGGEFASLMTSLVVPTEDGDAPLNISRIADLEPISDEIWAITASNGPVKGRLSTVPYHLKSPGSKTFQMTWMTYLETDVAPGASGTWIVDCWTHELVGQVVARQPDSRLAYVVPASFIKNDIESQLDCDVSLPASRSTRNNALHQAAEKGKEDIIRRLLERGADIESLDRGYTALHFAAEIGHDNVVRSLLEVGANAEAETWVHHRTALHLAGINGHANIIRLLLEFGVTTEAKDIFENIVLHLAAENGQEQVIRLLIGSGKMSRTKFEMNAQIDARNILEKTALHMAAQNGHTNVARRLLEGGADIEAEAGNRKTALHLAAENDRSNVLKVLIESGAQIDARDRLGKTALHLVAEAGYANVVQILLERDAKVEAKDESGTTALHLAAQEGYTDIILLLLGWGANIKAEDSFGRTASHLAAQNGHANVIQVLLRRGANIERATEDGSTVLHLAAQEGHAHTVQFLLEQNVNVEAQTDNGRTALHLAALKGHAGVVQLLAEQGAIINAKTVYKKTALHYAAAEGYELVVLALLDNGADIECEDLWGDSPWDLADRQGRERIARLLFDQRIARKFSDPSKGPARTPLPSLLGAVTSPFKDQFIAHTSPYTSPAAETGYKGKGKPSSSTDPNVEESSATHSEGVNSSSLPMKRREEDVAVHTKRKKRVGHETLLFNSEASFFAGRDPYSDTIENRYQVYK